MNGLLQKHRDGRSRSRYALMVCVLAVGLLAAACSNETFDRQEAINSLIPNNVDVVLRDDSGCPESETEACEDADWYYVAWSQDGSQEERFDELSAIAFEDGWSRGPVSHMAGGQMHAVYTRVEHELTIVIASDTDMERCLEPADRAEADLMQWCDSVLLRRDVG